MNTVSGEKKKEREEKGKGERKRRKEKKKGKGEREGRKGREKEKGEREGRERVKKGSEQVLTCEHGERGKGKKSWM